MIRGAETEARSSTMPERIGRYELLLPIGTGGMATVYLARTPLVQELHRLVAIKLMHPHLLADEGSGLGDFLQEARVAACIRHPNVVPILDVNQDSQGVYLVMEYVEGDTLSGLVRACKARGDRIPFGVAGRILADSLAGLHAAHEAVGPTGESLNIVHRDFSPQNILVGLDGVSRLTDFGIARASSRPAATASGIVKGKVGYMAPEQAMSKVLDRRCDVWAAGVVVWEVLAGRHLYDQRDAMATMLKVVTEPAPSISTVRPDLAPDIDEAISSALQREVEQRCPSAFALRQRLAEAWRKAGEVADTLEVAEWVRATVGKKIEQRRERAASILELRSKMQTLSQKAAVQAHADASGTPTSLRENRVLAPASPVSEQDPSEIPTARKTVEETPKALRRNRVGVILVSVFALGSLVAAATWRLTRSQHEASLELPVPRVSEGSSSASSALGSAATIQSVESSKPGTLLVRANAPITTLRVGTRTVAILKPAQEIEVQVPQEESHQGTLQIEAVSMDGRTISVKVDSAGPVASLSFPPSSAVRPGKGKSGVQGGVGGQPGLAPPPYKP